MKLQRRKTPLIRPYTLRELFGFPNLYIKDESCQEYGTWKDRRSRMIVKQALKEGIDKLVVLTAGNAGYSLAKVAQPTSLKVCLVIDNQTPPRLKKRLKSVCHELIELDLSEKIVSSQELIELSREDGEEEIWDVTNGWEHVFESIIDEIKHLKPDYIICPVGSGEGFVGLSEGIEKHDLKARLIGITPKSKKSVADKLTAIWTPYTKRIEKMTKGKTTIVRTSERSIKTSYQCVKNQVNCEPSSAIVFTGLSLLRADKNAVIVLINTGKGDN